MNILQRAEKIVFERSEEPERQYGPFAESMEKTAKMATLMGTKQIDAIDVYNVLIALKLCRESYGHKEDNYLDAITYLAQKNEVLTKP